MDDLCQWGLICHQDSVLPDSIRLSLSPAVPMFWLLFLLISQENCSLARRAKNIQMQIYNDRPVSLKFSFFNMVKTRDFTLEVLPHDNMHQHQTPQVCATPTSRPKVRAPKESLWLLGHPLPLCIWEAFIKHHSHQPTGSLPPLSIITEAGHRWQKN